MRKSVVFNLGREPRGVVCLFF